MIPEQGPVWLIASVVFLLGAGVGRWLCTCIDQLPREETIVGAWRRVWQRSRRSWSGWQDVPVVGGLQQLRQGERSLERLRPWLIELLNGGLVAWLYVAMFPAGGQPWSASAVITPWTALAQPGGSDLTRLLLLYAQFAYYVVLVEALVIATFIDFDLMVIPDAITLPAAAVGLAGSLIGTFYLVPYWFQDPLLSDTLRGLVPAPLSWCFTGQARASWVDRYPMLHGLTVSVLGIIVGGGVVWAIRIVGGWVLGREAMGFGDVVLMGMIGAFLGWQPTVLVFFLAPACALAVVGASWLFRQHRELPYGPYLSLAAFLLIVGWQSLWPYVERYFALGALIPMLGVCMLVLFGGLLMGVRLVFRMLGLSGDELQQVDWTSADQLQFFASKDPHAGTGPLRRPEWPGAASGTGQHQVQRWQGRTPWHSR